MRASRRLSSISAGVAQLRTATTITPAGRGKTAYLDGELCGVGADGLPNFAETQAATDGARGVRLVFYAFDLLHLDGRDTAERVVI